MKTLHIETHKKKHYSNSVNVLQETRTLRFWESYEKKLHYQNCCPYLPSLPSFRFSLLFSLPLSSLHSNVKSEHEILSYLKNGTLVGLLPVPHPILIRKYQVGVACEQGAIVGEQGLLYQVLFTFTTHHNASASVIYLFSHGIMLRLSHCECTCGMMSL